MRYFQGVCGNHLLTIIIIVLSGQFFSCKDDNEVVLPDPISDDVLSSEYPRIAITPEHLEEFKEHQVQTQQWNDLITRMNSMVTTGDMQYGFGAFHFAMAYAVTGEQKFAAQSKKMIFQIIQEPGYCDLTSTYLRAPDCTGQVALASDVLFDQLTDGEKETIFNYLETTATNIVDQRNWSGWGWQEGNPSFRQLNNYYPGHLQTILHYALLAYNHRELARDYFKLVVEDELPAALDLMRNEIKGGHGAEGTWYDDKLFGHYAEVVLMLREATNGKVDFGKEYADVFSDYVKFRLYSFNPVLTENGKPQLYHLATGDQPAVALAKVIDLARLRLWLLMDVLKNTSDADAAGYIKHFEQTVNFESKGWQREFQLYYLLHYDASVSTKDYTQELDRAYLSEGKGVAHYRTGWESDALTATIHFSPSQGQRNSHWHFGEGAFYIWYKGWQADHLNRVEGSGVRQNTGLMNTLLVNSDEQSQGAGDSEVLLFKGNENFMVVKGDATANYKDKLERFERTFIVTDKVITVYDRVMKKSASDVINFIVTSESGFQQIGSDPQKYQAENGEGRITVKTMTAGGSTHLQPMRMKVDFGSAESELHLLHAMEVGDRGSASADMTPVQSVESDGGSFQGVQYVRQTHAYVHLVNAMDTPASSVSYSVSFTGGVVNHLLTGMAPGTFAVKQDGVISSQHTVEADGVLYFETTQGGNFTIEKQ